MNYASSTPETFAAAIAAEINTDVNYRSVATDTPEGLGRTDM